MFRENLSALLLLYTRPAAGASRILDHGRLWFAVVAALFASIVVHVPQRGTGGPEPRASARARREFLKSLQQAQARGETPEAAAEEATNRALAAASRRPGPLETLEDAAGEWTAVFPGGTLAPLGAVFLVFIPILVAARAVTGFGSFGVLMRSEYLSLLMCVLMSWTAAYLPAGVLAWMLPAAAPWLFGAAAVYFMILAAISLRTALGTGAGAAAGLAVLGSCAAIVGLALYDAAGSFRFYLMSPFLLYYAYAFFLSDLRSLGEGLRSRQRLAGQLEIATQNPRDADAHYQLGLIYQKRRQFTEAIARFERAIAIDPSESDPYLQLGRIALEQNRAAGAIGYLEQAAKLDDKASSSEVWRDLGTAYLAEGRTQEAVAALGRYADRRPYDPEGLFRLGKALAAIGRTSEARARFEECIEAVKTSPGHRRAHIRKWSGEARSALRALK